MNTRIQILLVATALVTLTCCKRDKDNTPVITVSDPADGSREIEYGQDAYFTLIINDKEQTIDSLRILVNGSYVMTALPTWNYIGMKI